MGKKCYPYRILMGKPEAKRSLERPRRKWVVKIKIVVRMGWYALVGSGWDRAFHNSVARNPNVKSGDLGVHEIYYRIDGCIDGFITRNLWVSAKFCVG
jgi:hypothetical protein